MAQDPFSFYRGSACLFYADVAEQEDRYADERTARVWIQGDLHAENYGTYLNDAGIIVFDVNDFDEAYLGHFTWDLERMAASLALLGFTKALSDDTIHELIEAYASAYAEQVQTFHHGEDDEEFRLTLENTDGALHAVLVEARLKSRWQMLERMTAVKDDDRGFKDGPGVRRLDDDEREEVLAAYESYLETIPDQKRQHSVSYEVKDVVGRTGFGIGSAGLPAYNLLVEGRSQALENDVVLSMKQGNVAAPSRVVEDERITEYFEHPGHRTAISQRALQAHADPWLGWCELRGNGQVVQEISPYEADLDWDHVSEPDEMLPLLRCLGQATARGRGRTIDCSSTPSATAKYPASRSSRARWRSGPPARGPRRRASRRCCAGACAPCSSRAPARGRSACRPCPRRGASAPRPRGSRAGRDRRCAWRCRCPAEARTSPRAAGWSTGRRRARPAGAP